MQAIILAGGQGLRLRPYTTVIPKPLMPIANKPILEIILNQLKINNFKDIIISTGYLSDLIRAYFGDGKRYGLKIHYVYEKKPLGTAGALKLIKNLDENFLVMNGDILCNLNFKNFFNYHLKNKAYATISITNIPTILDYGIVKINKDFQLIDYLEKPCYNNFVSMGIYALNKKSVTEIKKDKFTTMPELLLKIKNSGKKVCCKKYDGFWLDIGKPEDYQKALDLVLDKKIKFIKNVL